MKPISEWTDDELDAPEVYGIDSADFAAEVLRLRADVERQQNITHKAEADLAAAHAELRGCEQDRMGIANWHRLEKAEERVEELLADLAAARAEIERLNESNQWLAARHVRAAPVVEAALAWGDRPPWSPDADEVALMAAVDAYRAAQGGGE